MQVTYKMKIIVLIGTVILAVVCLIAQTGGTYSKESLKHLEKYSHLEKLLKKIQPSSYASKKEGVTKSRSSTSKHRESRPRGGEVDEVIIATPNAAVVLNGEQPEVPGRAEVESARERKKHKNGGQTSAVTLANLQDLQNLAQGLGMLSSSTTEATGIAQDITTTKRDLSLEIPESPKAPKLGDIKANLAKSAAGKNQKPRVKKPKKHNREPRHPNNNREIEQVSHHMLHMSRKGACRIPSVHVIRVQDFYPNPGLIYLPQCTFLHQCKMDTGCCHETLTCGPKETQTVELPFYVLPIHNGSRGVIHNLTFENHTECECQDQLAERMPRLQEHGPRTDKTQEIGKSSLGTQRSTSLYQPVKESTKSSNHSSKLNHCVCPAEMSPRTNLGSVCSCDCFMDQRTCLRIKKGHELLSFKSRGCVEEKICQKPSCVYGNYIHILGRCPKKSEQNANWLNLLEG